MAMVANEQVPNSNGQIPIGLNLRGVLASTVISSAARDLFDVTLNGYWKHVYILRFSI